MGGENLLTVVMLKVGKMRGNKMKQTTSGHLWNNAQSIQNYKTSPDSPVKVQPKRDGYTERERLREKMV